ncbi:MAG: hemerythrin domain-containing protein [Actinomycetota bacterium]|nr:MAG: hemerythrin domain-containing protein [Actinomycetota bacterium]
MPTNSELIALIGKFESEHVEVREALAKIDAGVAARDEAAVRSALADSNTVLVSGLDEHSSAEDDVLFPGVASLLGQGMLDVFVEEHVRILALRNQIYASMEKGVPDYEGCSDFSELLSSHIDREDSMLFPAARGMLSD